MGKEIVWFFCMSCKFTFQLSAIMAKGYQLFNKIVC